MELGSALSVMIATFIAVPVSTTQCQVGSVVAVGMINRKIGRATNWRLFAGIVFTWALSLVVAGGLSAAFFALLKPVVRSVLPNDLV